MCDAPKQHSAFAVLDYEGCMGGHCECDSGLCPAASPAFYAGLEGVALALNLLLVSAALKVYSCAQALRGVGSGFALL